MFEKRFLQSECIRVLVNGIHAKSGGGVTYLRNIMPLLAEDDDLELHLFLHRDQFALFGVIDERIRVHLLDFSNGFFTNLIWEQLVLPLLAKSMSVDVTVSPANYGPLMAPRQIIMLRNSLAVVGRETRIIKRLYWFGLALMTGLSLLTCRRAIAVSGYARSALTFGMGRLFRKKVSVIHHGVRDMFEPAPASSDGHFILTVSDIYVQKNLHTLIGALAQVKRDYPDLKLKVAGKAIDAGYQEEVKAAVYAAGLTDNVEFLGEKSTEELVELYQTCTLFAFPSTVETFGNPLVEAMSCGAPIVSSNTAAMPEILGDAASFFDPLDVEGMAGVISDLMGNARERRALSEKSLARSQKYSWRQTATKTADVIKSIAPARIRQDQMTKMAPNP
ncbi:MAG: glycosyltransferase [Rhodospirillaceae bacterium]|nr:glycosyltransferase [Rhodospirillaceae bacterium]